MQRTRVRRVAALAIGLSLVAAACGDDDDAEPAGTEAGGTEAPAGTEAPSEETEAPSEETEAPDETTAEDGTEPAAAGETVEAAPTCTGESDGTLNFATVLPETGSLAFLGPPEFAASQLAVNDINAAGGVLDQDVTLD